MTTPSRIKREMPQRYRLEAGKCLKCGTVHYPPRLICRDCRSKSMETVELSKTCKLITHTIIEVPPGPFVDEAPYAVGIVETDEGARLTCQVVDVDFDKLKPGFALRLEFRLIQSVGEDGVLCYGHKAVPA